MEINSQEWSILYFKEIEGGRIIYRVTNCCLAEAIEYGLDKAFWVYYTIAFNNLNTGSRPSKYLQQRISNCLRYYKHSSEIHRGTLVLDIRIVYDIFDQCKYEELKWNYVQKRSRRPFNPILPQPELWKLLLPITYQEKKSGRSECYSLIETYQNIWRYVVETEDYVALSFWTYDWFWEDLMDIAGFFLGTEKKYGEGSGFERETDPIDDLNNLYWHFLAFPEKRKKELMIDSALKKLVYDFFISLTQELIRKKIIIRCQNCDFFARYYPGKKFCSPRTDGLDCSRAYFSRQDYHRHRDKRLPAIKARMRQFRLDMPGY